MAKLTRDEVRCAMMLKNKGQSVRAIARQLQVAESTFRERLERERTGAVVATISAGSAQTGNGTNNPASGFATGTDGS